MYDLFKPGAKYTTIKNPRSAGLRQPPSSIPEGEVVRFLQFTEAVHDNYVVLTFANANGIEIMYTITVEYSEPEPDWAQYFVEKND